MKTVSSLLDTEWYARYKRISKLNIRSSIYDVTNRCNLRCKGCFFFSSGEHRVASEENDEALVLRAQDDGETRYVVMFDPLDGSSNLDVAGGVGVRGERAQQGAASAHGA